MPSMRPASLRTVNASESQNTASTATNSDVLELKMALKAAGMRCAAKANSENGMAQLKAATTA